MKRNRLARPHHESRCEIMEFSYIWKMERRIYQNYRCYVRLLVSILPPKKKTKIDKLKKEGGLAQMIFLFRNPRHSMYGIFTYIW